MDNSKVLNLSNLTQVILANWPVELASQVDYCVALSGGIDSIVLLDILHQLSQLKPIKLSAIHVNHGISPNALVWQNFCQQFCQQRNIPLSISQIQVHKIAGEGLENSARKLRYQQFQESSANVIVLAHHQDDQIETMLSQILRGSDLHNSAAMRNLVKRQQQYYWRPLLNLSKVQLLNYALEHNLNHIEDESNQDNRYLRNFLRNQIIPQLIDFDRYIQSKLINSVEQLQLASQLNDELATIDYQQIKTINGDLNRQLFSQLSNLRQRNLLSYYLRLHQLPLPSNKQLNEFIRQTIQAATHRQPKLNLSKFITLVARTKIIVLDKLA
jgi:tRNA(Ile)-lysidine synthase